MVRRDRLFRLEGITGWAVGIAADARMTDHARFPPHARAHHELTLHGKVFEDFRHLGVEPKRGDAARFLLREDGYRAQPEITGTRLYLETMEEVLPGKKKMIMDAGKGRRHLLLLEDGIEIAPPGAAVTPLPAREPND